jgi:hypothetical protein
MTREEIIHGLYRGDSKAIKEAIKTLEQEPCEDAVSRKAVLNTLNRMDSVLDEDRTVPKYKELLVACYNDLPPVTPERNVLDKIRAEIEELKNAPPCFDDMFEYKYAVDECLEIIDKYKAEREG